MTSTKRRYAKDEFARRGDAIFEKVVRPRITSSDEARFAAIDIETEEYEVADDEFEAGARLRARLPDAQIWIVRIGSRAVHRFGGWHPRGSR